MQYKPMSRLVISNHQWGLENIYPIHHRTVLYRYIFSDLVDCEWNDWQKGKCSVTCGGGTLTKTRSPKFDAQHGGQECTGQPEVTESCNIQECPGNVLIILQNSNNITRNCMCISLCDLCSSDYI